jgi:hypothetical protein
MRVAILVAALALAGGSVARAAGPADVTLQCTELVKGGLPLFTVYAAPGGNPPAGDDNAQPPPGFRPVDNGLTVETGDAAYILRLTPLATGYEVDHRLCKPTKTKPPLGPRGLPKVTTLTTSDQGEFSRRCIDVARITMRLRVVNDGDGKPLRAQLAIVRAKTRKPLVYVDWARDKVTAWTSPVCD